MCSDKIRKACLHTITNSSVNIYTSSYCSIFILISKMNATKSRLNATFLRDVLLHKKLIKINDNTKTTYHHVTCALVTHWTRSTR